MISTAHYDAGEGESGRGGGVFGGGGILIIMHGVVDRPRIDPRIPCAQSLDGKCVCVLRDLMNSCRLLVYILYIIYIRVSNMYEVYNMCVWVFSS